ncbi:MAG: hypothetical protein AAGE80_03915 [Pseudomonadota bacterium]
MRVGLLTIALATALASCGPTIVQRCAAEHGKGNAAFNQCVEVAETKILTGPGSAFAKSRRGGPG